MTFSKFIDECKSLVGEYGKNLTVPPKNEADLTLPCFFSDDPVNFSKSLENKINSKRLPKLIKSVKSAGPYLNFYVNENELSKETLKEILERGNLYGSDNEGKIVVIDYSSPNIAKPMNIGHLRSTIIGDSLKRIYNHLGWKVIADNHIGDWGTQFGKLIYGFLKWSSYEKLKEHPIEELLRVYVKFHQEAEKNDELNNKAREYFMRLENNDEEFKKIWKLFVDLSLEEFKKMYELLDIKFDYYIGESFYVPLAKKLVEELLKEKVAKINDDKSIYIDLKPYGLTDLIIMKSDGSTLYQTRELAAIKYREEKFNPDKILYVVGAEQSLYFRQVFKSAEIMGFNSDKYEHVGFGLVLSKDGKLSTRRGKIILLNDVISKSISLAMDIMKDRNIENKEYIAKIIGIGAVKFNDLKQNRIKDVVFDWNKVMNLEGDSGPYVQYTNVRIKSILKKSNKTPKEGFIPKTETEKSIVKELSKFPNVIKKSQLENKPNYIANYLLDLCGLFNKFYHETKIIDSDDEKEKLGFIKSISIVLEIGLYLLGIKCPEKM